MTPHDQSNIWKRIQEQVAADPQIRERFEAFVNEGLEPYLTAILDGIERVGTLLLLAQDAGLLMKHWGKSWAEAELKTKAAAGDVLRAAVVLTHAYLEDFLKTILTLLLPQGDEATLSDIPFAAVKGGPKELSLGRLAQHRGKSVEDILRESVSAYLDRHPINNKGEIKRLLEKAGLDISKCEDDLDIIQEMIQRRHLIVHRADKFKAPGSETYSLRTIDQEQVDEWRSATTRFLVRLASQVTSRALPPVDIARKLGISTEVD